MTASYFAFALILAVAQLLLSKRWAFLPLLLATCHLGNVEFLGQLTAVRLIILLGLIRALMGGFLAASPRDPINLVFYVFGFFAVLSGLAHGSEPNPFSLRIGLAFNVIGCTLYTRSYVSDETALRTYLVSVAIILIPLAALMLAEKVTGKNVYLASGLTLHGGGVREGRMRACGPFRSPILAGTAGAVGLPLALYLLKRRTGWGVLAAGSCVTVAVASGSSGPLSALFVGAGCVCLWRVRSHLRQIQIGLSILAVLYMIIKGRPIWYVMASIDIVGGSTGWHRARLMDQGFHYLGEWWLAGTDYTRHWMATGVSWSQNHTDLTNYYLHLGVIGGLALPLCVLSVIVICFRRIGAIVIRWPDGGSAPDRFLFWCAGSSLAAHSISFVSVSYFDQIFVLFYSLVGAIGCASFNMRLTRREYQSSDATTMPLEKSVTVECS